MRKVLLAFQFLTIVPVKVAGDITEKDVAGAAAFFPLVGGFQGLLIAVPAFLLMKVFPADIAAGFAILSLILSNGGFDLDGLADTFDGLSVKSSGDPEKDKTKRLEVMKDSATGAMGVIALIVTILLKYILMNRLLSDFPALAVSAMFFLLPVFSKWITVPAMYYGASAREDGLGKIFIEHTGSESVIISTSTVILLFTLVSSLNLIGLSAVRTFEMCLFFTLIMFLFSFLAVSFLKTRFGGLTGDHFGALTEVSEILFLWVTYIWLQRSIL